MIPARDMYLADGRSGRVALSISFDICHLGGAARNASPMMVYQTPIPPSKNLSEEAQISKRDFSVIADFEPRPVLVDLAAPAPPALGCCNLKFQTNKVRKNPSSRTKLTVAVVARVWHRSSRRTATATEIAGLRLIV